MDEGRGKICQVSYLILLFSVLLHEESVENHEFLLLQLCVFLNNVRGVDREVLLEGYM